MGHRAAGPLTLRTLLIAIAAIAVALGVAGGVVVAVRRRWCPRGLVEPFMPPRSGA